MKKYSMALLAAMAWLMGCAPSASPTPYPATSPVAAPVPATARPEVPAKSPGETAWEKLTERARKEGQVTIYSFNFTGDVGIAMARAFQNKYGITLNVITGRGAEFVERLKTEKRLGKMVADAWEGSTVFTISLKDAGLTESAPELPVLQEKGVWLVEPLAMDPEGHALSLYPSYWSPWVNTRLVKPEQEPKSFADLLKPEWKGKIISYDPNVSSSGYLYYVPLVNARVLDWEYVRALGKQEQRLVLGIVQAADGLVKGEAPLLAANTNSSMGTYVEVGAPVKAISMREGDVANPATTALIKGAPHPNAGRVLANWLLGPEAQTVLTKAKALSSIRKDVTDFRPPGARAPSTRIVVATAKDLDDSARLMREKFLIELWKK